MTQGYEEDLAYIHDVGFGDFSKKSAPGLLEILRQKGIQKGLVIDIGCGSGIWANALTEAGYDVLGIDISDAMLDLARIKAPKANLQKASFVKFNFPKCAAVTSLGECLNYQFDEHDKSELKDIFARIYQALRPGGIFIFDIAQPGYVSGINAQTNYYEGEDWVIFLEKQEDTKKNKLIRKISMFRKIGEFYRKSEETHIVQLYKSTEVAKELREVGFRVRIIRGYGELKLRKAVAGFIATKA
jgi:SAM-dependent methyltransferase